MEAYFQAVTGMACQTGGITSLQPGIVFRQEGLQIHYLQASFVQGTEDSSYLNFFKYPEFLILNITLSPLTALGTLE